MTKTIHRDYGNLSAERLDCGCGRTKQRLQRQTVAQLATHVAGLSCRLQNDGQYQCVATSMT